MLGKDAKLPRLLSSSFSHLCVSNCIFAAHFLKYCGMIAWIMLLASCQPQPETAVPPNLIFEESVAPDFRVLARETWDVFMGTFAQREDCFGDVQLQADAYLADRAVYDPDMATVTVRVPGTLALLREALVHEWAHHVEFQCEAHQTMRPAFLAAQGLPVDSLWRPDATPLSSSSRQWAEIPSEQYAEAAVQLVLGRRQISTGIRVTQEAVRVIEAWAAGD